MDRKNRLVAHGVFGVNVVSAFIENVSTFIVNGVSVPIGVVLGVNLCQRFTGPR